MQHGPMNHADHDERPPREAPSRRPDTAAGNDGKGQSLFSDLSVPQVAAGALAAVTSMLLSNQIGIAGSVIGVAVGSVVSTVASSLYKRAIARGADRIKEKIVLPGEETQGGAQAAGAGTSGTGAAGHPAGAADESGTVTSDGTRIAPEHLRERARERHDRTVQKRVTVGVLAVAVAAAIVGVWLSAGFVTLATGGQGLGEKVSIVHTTRDDAAGADKGPDAASGDKAATDGASATGTGSPTAADGTATSDGTSGSAGSTTGTGSGSDSGADGTGSGTGADAGGGNGTGTDGGTGTGSGTGADASGSGTGTGGTSGSTGSGTGAGTGTSTGSAGGGAASAQSQGGASQGATATNAS